MSEGPQKVNRWPGSATLLDMIPPGWNSRGQAAKLVGRDRDTLKRWHKTGTYEPSGYMDVGRLTIWLYSDQDIENMMEIAGHMKAGRPKQEEELA